MELAGIHFVGTPDPSGHLLPLVLGAGRLSRQAVGSFVIVNTTGFVQGTGRVLKAYKIQSVEPDLLVAIERGGELEPILQASRHLPMLRLPPSVLARTKTAAERTLEREKAFAGYFASAERLKIDPDELVIQRVSPAAESDFVPNLLCGTADGRGQGTGLAIIDELDLPRRRLSLVTPVPRERIRILQLGDIRIETDGREIASPSRRKP